MQRSRVFSGLGYAADGPYLLVNDVYGKKQMRLPVLGRTFTLRHTQKRFLHWAVRFENLPIEGV